MNLSDPLILFLAKEPDLINDATKYVLTAALHTILHGNSRNFFDVLEALKSIGAITKTGRIAFNRKGATYRAILEAMKISKEERNEFILLFPQHKGAPTAEMVAHAELRASAISDKFRETFAPKK